MQAAEAAENAQETEAHLEYQFQMQGEQMDAQRVSSEAALAESKADVAQLSSIASKQQADLGRLKGDLACAQYWLQQAEEVCTPSGAENTE
jgi:hypothetical protein